VVLLALLTTVMTAAGRTDVQLAGNLRRAAAAEAAADGGVNAAIFHVSDAPARAWQPDDQPHQMQIGSFAVTIHLTDENGKLNPNYAPAQLMAALISAVGVDPGRAATLAQAISDWHAAQNPEQLVQQYRTAGMAVAPTGQPFRSVEELGLVMGMTPDVLARLRPYVSVYAPGPLAVSHSPPLLQAVVQSLQGSQPSTPAARPTAVSIVADARRGDGSRYIRHAIVHLGTDAVGRPFRVLQWEALAAPG
jgi:general secretion pathway protein K